MTRALLRLLPGAVLVLAATVLLHAAPLRPTASTLVPVYPAAVFGGGLLLTLRFNRGRFALALLLLLVAERALAQWVVTAPAASDTARAIFNALALLLPLDLAALAWVPERGVLAVRTRIALAGLAAQTALVAALTRLDAAAVAGWLEYAFLGEWRAPLAQPALLAFAVAFAVTGSRFVLYRTAADGGALWTVAAALLALRAGGGGLEATVHLATAGLVLVVALIETSYGMAYGDELTGLPGRRALNEALTALRGTYAVAMVDIDHFKKFNDTHGHDVGDQLLRMIGARLEATGGGGKAFRYGGEEFAVLFSGKSVEEALPYLEALRRSIETAGFRVRAPGRPRRKPDAPRAEGPDRRRVSVTVSIGAAGTGPDDATPQEVIQAADEALYRAKRAGRNRIRV